VNSEVWVDVTNLAAIFSIYSVATNLVIGWAGIPAVIPTAFGGAGGYAAGWFAQHYSISAPLGVLIAIVVGGAIGLILSDPSMRLSNDYVILLTVSAGSVIVAIITAVSHFGGQAGFLLINQRAFGLKLDSVNNFLPFTLGLAFLTYLVVRWLGNSMYGVVLKGLREDELAVRASGFNTKRAKVTAFTISAALCGMAGALYVLYLGIVGPASFNFNQSVLILTMVIIGGLGRPIGPVVGAVVAVFLPRLLTQLGGVSASTSAQLQQIIFGLALVAVVLWRPSGLIGEVSSPIVRRFVKKAAQGGRLVRGETSAGLTADVAASLPPALRESVIDAAPAAPTGTDITPERMILRARGLRKRFGGLVVADGFDFDLPAGQIVGLVGPNGAGKTTLFNLLSGALRPDAGSVSLLDIDVTGRQIDQVVRIGMVRSFQEVRLSYALSVLENVLLGAIEPQTIALHRMVFAPRAVRRETQSAMERALAALELIKLQAKPLQRTADLSFGEQKQVALARVIATEAQILLLDEPVAGVSSDIAQAVLELIRQLARQGRTILLVEHNLEAVRDVATSVYFLESGGIRAHGTYEERIADPELAASYFGSVATDPK
jgi:branched-chain amino acid transport system permease protein